jgi:2',3'-cyclic-nucleotide 2'-phosphodiesterase (5'-nucleotidase family)
VLQVEAGNWTYDSTGYFAPVMLQNDQFVRAYSRWPVDVVNLGRYDLIYAQRLLAREGLTERLQSRPFIKNVISANGIFGADVAAPAPYLIKEVTGPRITGKKNKLRIGFVGLAEPVRPGGGVMDATVRNMYEAARAVVPKARKECDVLVIIAHAELDGAMRLARENPEADVVIAGNAEGLFKPREVGTTMVVSAAPGNIQQGDLRLYFDREGHVSFKWRSTDLDALVPADAAAEAFAEAARQERASYIR